MLMEIRPDGVDVLRAVLSTVWYFSLYHADLLLKVWRYYYNRHVDLSQLLRGMYGTKMKYKQVYQ